MIAHIVHHQLQPTYDTQRSERRTAKKEYRAPLSVLRAHKPPQTALVTINITHVRVCATVRFDCSPARKRYAPSVRANALLHTSQVQWTHVRDTLAVGSDHRMAVRPWKSSIDDESEASPLLFGPGKTFQKRRVSSPAPVTIVWPSGDIARYSTRSVCP